MNAQERIALHDTAVEWAKSLGDHEIYSWLDGKDFQGNKRILTLNNVQINALRNERLDRLSQ